MDEIANAVGVNRRSCARYRCTAAVEIFHDNCRWGWGSVNEISQGGCYIEIVQLLPVDAMARLRLTMDELTLEAPARVATNDFATGMGMQFLPMADEQERILHAMLRKVGAPEGPCTVPFASKPEKVQAAAQKTIHITPEAMPKILGRVIAMVNERGVVTRQDLAAIVKECV